MDNVTLVLAEPIAAHGKDVFQTCAVRPDN